MFLRRFLDICFRLLLYESIAPPLGVFKAPPHPPFLKGGLPNKYTVSGGFYPLTSTKTLFNNTGFYRVELKFEALDNFPVFYAL
ncbi:MAG: hypothetical protein Q8M83_01865, partial [bacterium]|nr:hypothetical protein [bacterium]